MPPADPSLTGTYLGHAGGPASSTASGQPVQAPAVQTGLLRVEERADAPAFMPSQSMQSSDFPPQAVPFTPPPGQHEDGRGQDTNGQDLARSAAPTHSRAVIDGMTVIPLDEGRQHRGHGPGHQVAATTNTQGGVTGTAAAAGYAGVQLGAAQDVQRTVPGSHAEDTTTTVPHQPAKSAGRAADATLEEGRSRASWMHDASHAAARGSPSRSPQPRHLQGLPDRPTSSEGVAGTSEDEVRHWRRCAGL